MLDIGMPGMDGLEVARRLRDDLGLNDVLLVAMTGYGQDEDRRRSQIAGFNSHLVKPVDLERLNALLEHWQQTMSGENRSETLMTGRSGLRFGELRQAGQTVDALAVLLGLDTRRSLLDPFRSAQATNCVRSPAYS